MLQPQDWIVDDFSGGITDFYVGAPKNTAQIMDNFFILQNRSIKSRAGSVIDNEDEPLTDSVNTRIGAIINYNNDDALLTQQENKIFYRADAEDDPDLGYVELVGPVDGNSIFPVGATTNFLSWTEWNRHLIVVNDVTQYATSGMRPQKIFKDENGDFQVRTAGLPALGSVPTVTGTSGGGENYIYFFHLYYEYTVGNQTFFDAGPVTQVAVENVNPPTTNAIEITEIPTLVNGTDFNYDTERIEIRIFRTTDNGTEGFFVGSIVNGTETYTDTVADTDLEDGELIYTSGGVLDNDPPPMAKFVHTVGGFTYYGWLSTEDEELPNQYQQSIQGDPDSCPGAFRDEAGDVITGISSAGDIPVLLCERYVYRIEGTYDEFGQGFMTHVEISDKAGCVSHQGVVKAEGRIFWAGNDGFYTSDGYKVDKISFHLKESYAEYISLLSDTRKIQGIFNEVERRIYWTFQTSGSSTDVDACIVLDLEWGIRPESTFTTISGGTSFSPTSIAMFEKQFYRADRRGYVFKHDDEYLTDPLIDTDLTPDLWATSTIIWNYKGPAFNFGTTLIRKWVPRITMKGKNEGNTSIQINGIVDDGRVSKSCQEIRFRGNFTWGDSEFEWGNLACVWGPVGLINQWRRFPARGLRCDYFQVQITNAFTIVTNSDTLGQATFSNTLNTVTLDDVTEEWPTDSIDYYIATEEDDYEHEFLVTERTATELTVLDPGNILPTGSLKWILKGYKKQEVLNLLNYNIAWAPLTMSQPTYQGATGGNAS